MRDQACQGLTANLIRLISLLAVLLLTGCIEERREIGPEVIGPSEQKPVAGAVAVNDILADRQGFRGREVTVAGKVMPGLAFEFVSEQPYRIIQGESLLWVITNDIAPQEGSFVNVRGSIAAPYQIKGRSYDVVLVEKERL